MIENIEILLSYNNLSVNEIFANLSSNDSLNLLGFIDKINLNLSNEISSYVLSDNNKKYILTNKYLNINDKENLIKFFSTFGKTDLNGQLINCKSYKEIFKKAVNNLEENENKDCKSIGTIILGIGILLIILIY